MVKLLSKIRNGGAQTLKQMPDFLVRGKYGNRIWLIALKKIERRRPRRNHSAAFKAKVEVEALKEGQTILYVIINTEELIIMLLE
jgi:hypothetical protein